MNDLSAAFVPARLTADVGHLSQGDRAALLKLIEAARWLDPLFDRQAYAKNPEIRATLEADASAEGRARLEAFEIMRGPWDRQDHYKPFVGSAPHPPGAGFYPEALTAEAFRAFVDAHPAERAALESLFTVVEQRGDALTAVPYAKAYAAWLAPAARLLEEAAALTDNASLATFLRSRAAAFLSDDYYASDKDWMDLASPVEVTIGPYETYEDELLGLKASYEAFVTVTDPRASADLSKYKAMLPEMEAHLPVPDEVKTKRGAESPIRVVDLVFSSGDARKSVQTIAFNLPNDERVRAEKGAKKVLLRNVIQTKFERIMRPIAERILDPSQVGQMSAEAFFNETLFHELSHSLGPAFTTQNGAPVEVRIVLGNTYSAIEEAKADVMGAFNVLYMIDRGEFPKSFRVELLISYFAGLFRSTRFGVAEAHGKGAAVQINRFLEEGAARFDAGASRFTVELDKLEGAIERLVRDICLCSIMATARGPSGCWPRTGGSRRRWRRRSRASTASPWTSGRSIRSRASNGRLAGACRRRAARLPSRRAGITLAACSAGSPRSFPRWLMGWSAPSPTTGPFASSRSARPRRCAARSTRSRSPGRRPSTSVSS